VIKLPDGIPYFSMNFLFFEKMYEFIFNYNTSANIYFVNIFDESKNQIGFNAPLVSGSDLLKQTDINAELIYRSNTPPNLISIEGGLFYEEL